MNLIHTYACDLTGMSAGRMAACKKVIDTIIEKNANLQLMADGFPPERDMKSRL